MQSRTEDICGRKIKKQLFYARIFTKTRKEEFEKGTSISVNLPYLYDMDHLMNEMRTLMEMGPSRQSCLYGIKATTMLILISIPTLN